MKSAYSDDNSTLLTSDETPYEFRSFNNLEKTELIDPYDKDLDVNIGIFFTIEWHYVMPCGLFSKCKRRAYQY